MKKSILEANQSYTFSDYFKLSHPTRDVVAEFDYQFKLERIELPKKEIADLSFEKLKKTFYKPLNCLIFH